MMKPLMLTEEINQSLALINQDDHTLHHGLKEVLFESVGPLFDKEHNSFPLRPSSCVKPMRDLFYDLQNYYKPGSIHKTEIEPRVKLIFQFGHLTETLLKQICSHAFTVTHEQERVKYGELKDAHGNLIPLEGAIDWAMKYDGSLVLCDSKSIGDYPFKKAPKEEHIAQLQLYMHSDWGRANLVNKALLIYFNKNTSDLKCIEFAYDKVLAEKIIKRLELIWDYFQRNEVPPREYYAGLDWQADYSSYVDYDNREFALPEDQREVETINDFFKGPQLDKYALKEFINAHGNKVVHYLGDNKKVYVVYTEKKLKFIEKG